MPEQALDRMPRIMVVKIVIIFDLLRATLTVFMY